MRPTLVVAGCAAAGLLLASCGGGRQVTTGDASGCGPPYTAAIGRQTITANSCAGVIPAGDPMRFTVRVGERFRIAVTGDGNGRLAFPVPTPTDPGVRELGRRGGLVSYVAVAPGVTRLIARHTRLCMEARSEPRDANCPAAIVRVSARVPLSAG